MKKRPTDRSVVFSFCLSSINPEVIQDLIEERSAQVSVAPLTYSQRTDQSNFLGILHEPFALIFVWDEFLESHAAFFD